MIDLLDKNLYECTKIVLQTITAENVLICDVFYCDSQTSMTWVPSFQKKIAKKGTFMLDTRDKAPSRIHEIFKLRLMVDAQVQERGGRGVAPTPPILFSGKSAVQARGNMLFSGKQMHSQARQKGFLLL